MKLAAAVLITGAAALAGCARTDDRAAADAAAADLCAQRLAVFDTLDFSVFTGQHWDRLGESHAANITVTWPDGHETTGLEQHVGDLRAMFVYAPNTAIREHPIRICQGDYTAVQGIMTGTFSQPMPTSGGRSIPPTGRSFRLSMLTVGHWTGTTMDHEWLYWDNQAFMQQIGLAR